MKTIFSYALFICLAQSIFSQAKHNYLDIYFSFEENFFKDQVSSFDRRIGHSDGLNFQHYITDKLAYNIGLGVTSVLYKLESEFGTEAEGIFRVHSSTYLHMPLSFSYNMNPKQKINFIPKLGVQLGLPLRKKDIEFRNSRRYSFESVYDFETTAGVFNIEFGTAFEGNLCKRFKLGFMPFIVKQLTGIPSQRELEATPRFAAGLRGYLRLLLNKKED